MGMLPFLMDKTTFLKMIRISNFYAFELIRTRVAKIFPFIYLASKKVHYLAS